MSQHRISLRIALTICSLVFLHGCSDTFSPDDAGMGSPSTGFGATQGGVQDMGLARELIAAGRVPPPEAFTVEGMFSEHDLPLTGETSDSILNLRGGLGYAPDFSGQSAGWLQVGMSSNIDPESFQRPSLSVIACVDVSGSMGWNYSNGSQEYETPGSIARLLLSRIVAQLDADDRVGIVTYGSDVATPLAPVAANHPAVQAAIEAFNANGSTNMEAGLSRAFSVAHVESEATANEVRVLLFTDIQPNVGATSGASFRAMAEEAAQENIGLSVFGLGVGMRQEVMNVISDLRGGNAFSLFSANDVNELVEMNWPWMMVPIAHELTMEITAPTGITVESAYGFPGTTDLGLGFTVASVFPSHRKGALLACLKPEAGSSLSGASVTGQLTYATIAGETITQNLTWNFPDAPDQTDGQWFEQTTVGKTVALAVLVSGMESAARIYGDDPGGAVEIMQQVRTRVEADASRFEDADLANEAQLAIQLLALMEAEAPQGDLYGEFGK
jgi:Ca-activated chloride channel family protein